MAYVPPDQSFSPRLESLEAREVPAVLINVVDHTLQIDGGSSAAIISIADDGHGDITVNAGSEHVVAHGIRHIDIRTDQGNDTVDYTLTGELTQTETITAHLGSGNVDTHFDFAAGIGAHGHMTLTERGGSGSDTEHVKSGDVDAGGSLAFHVHDGSGTDSVYFHSVGDVGGRLVATNGNIHGDDSITLSDETHIEKGGSVAYHTW